MRSVLGTSPVAEIERIRFPHSTKSNDNIIMEYNPSCNGGKIQNIQKKLHIPLDFYYSFTYSLYIQGNYLQFLLQIVKFQA